MENIDDVIANSWKLLNEGDLEGSTKSFRACYESTPQNLEIINGLAECYRLQNEHENTIKFLNLSLEKNFSNTTLRTLSWVYIAVGKDAEACQSFLIYLEENPNEIEIREALLAASARCNLFVIFEEQLSYLLSGDQQLDYSSLANTLSKIIETNVIDSTTFLSKRVFNTEHSRQHSSDLLNANDSLIRNRLLSSAFELYNRENWTESKKFFLEISRLDVLNQEENKCFLNCCVQTTDSINGLKAFKQISEYRQLTLREYNDSINLINNLSAVDDILLLWPEIKVIYSATHIRISKDILQGLSANLITLITTALTAEANLKIKTEFFILVNFFLSKTSLELDMSLSASTSLLKASTDFVFTLLQFQPKEATLILNLFIKRNPNNIELTKSLICSAILTNTFSTINPSSYDLKDLSQESRHQVLEDILNLFTEITYKQGNSKTENELLYLLDLSDFITDICDINKSKDSIHIDRLTNLLIDMACEADNKRETRFSLDLIEKAYKVSPNSPEIIRHLAKLSTRNEKFNI